MSPWLGLCSSARRGAARGASGWASPARTARKIPPLWAGSGGCSTTFHGRLGAGVTISIDAVPGVFVTGLLQQHPICRKLCNLGRGLQGHSAQRDVAAAATARIDKAVQEVYERFEAACDDLDSGLFDLADRHCYCCVQFFAGAANSDNRAEDGHLLVHGVQLPGARQGRARWPAPRVRDHRSSQQPLQGLRSLQVNP
jgi:hypothetical protein